MKTINVFADGGARGNPGPAAIGVYITDQNGTMLTGFGKKIGTTTNNVAEYKAVLAALTWLLENRERITQDTKISFFLDSQLVVMQLTGAYKVKNAALRELFFTIHVKESELGLPVYYNHIPREKNQNADRFVNLALDNKD